MIVEVNNNDDDEDVVNDDDDLIDVGDVEIDDDFKLILLLSIKKQASHWLQQYSLLKLKKLELLSPSVLPLFVRVKLQIESIWLLLLLKWQKQKHFSLLSSLFKFSSNLSCFWVRRLKIFK